MATTTTLLALTCLVFEAALLGRAVRVSGDVQEQSNSVPHIRHEIGTVLFGQFKLTSFIGRHQTQVVPAEAGAASALLEVDGVPPQPPSYPKVQTLIGRPVNLYFPEAPAGFKVHDQHLGSGNYGDVWRAVRISDGTKVVLKYMVDPQARTFYTAAEAPATQKAMYAKECRLPQLVENACVKNPYLCHYTRHFGKCIGTNALNSNGNGEAVYVALEDAGEGSLDLDKWILQRPQERTAATLFDFTVQIHEALAVLHHLGWVHQDLKPDNIMVRPDKTLWLIDFGCANELGDVADQTLFGDRRWLGPEVHEKPAAKTSVFMDMWAAGLTVLYMYTQSPFLHAVPADFQAEVIRKLQMGSSSVAQEAKHWFCYEPSVPSAGLAQRCAALFADFVRMPTRPGAPPSTEQVPRMIALMTKVFRMPAELRWTADMVLEMLLGQKKAPTPWKTFKLLPPVADSWPSAPPQQMGAPWMVQPQHPPVVPL